MTRRMGAGALLGAGLMLVACNSVLGNEPVLATNASGSTAQAGSRATGEQPDGGATRAGDGTDAAVRAGREGDSSAPRAGGGRGGMGEQSDTGDTPDTGMDDAAGGGRSESGPSSQQAEAGAGGMVAAMTQAGAGAAPADTGDGAGGDAADGDGGEQADPRGVASAVRGTLVDSYHRPVSGARVWLGAESVVTDDQGSFQFPSVAAVYDIAFTVTRTNAAGTPMREVWRYEGLTRRDPTLQCYSGFAYHDSSLAMHVELDGFGQSGGPVVFAGFGSPDYVNSWWLDQADFLAEHLGWFGPGSETSGSLHAIAYEVDALGAPLRYLSYASVPVTLGAGQADVTLALSTEALPAFAVAGSVSGPGERTRSDLLVEHFTDGTELTLPVNSHGGESFSYLAPRLPAATTTLVALEGNVASTPYAVAVVTGLSTDRAGLALEIPRTPALTAPGDGKSDVDAETVFSWTLEQPRLAMFVAYTASAADTMYVVTSQTQVTLPVGPTIAYEPPAGASFTWYVYTRDAASTDEVTAGIDSTLLRSQWTTGQYAASVSRSFVTAQ